jgi:hypothetical protein
VFRRRKRGPVAPEVAGAFRGFGATVERVEAAKASLVAAVPTSRSAGAPLAEALAGFELGLQDARAAMPAWRAQPVEEQWRACQEAVERAAGGAERLRLEATPEGYERLYGELGDLLDALDQAFTAALERFRDLGV